jgi:hypothetical protein
VSQLYEQFVKFSKSEVQHFRKLEQQRKSLRTDKAPRPPHYNDNQRSYPKPVHNIDSDGCGPPENWEKNFCDISTRKKHENLQSTINPVQPKRRLTKSWSRPKPIHILTPILHVPWQRDRPSHKRLSHIPRI